MTPQSRLSLWLRWEARSNGRLRSILRVSLPADRRRWCSLGFVLWKCIDALLYGRHEAIAAVTQCLDPSLDPTIIANGPAGRDNTADQGCIPNELSGPYVLHDLLT